MSTTRTARPCHAGDLVLRASALACLGCCGSLLIPAVALVHAATAASEAEPPIALYSFVPASLTPPLPDILQKDLCSPAPPPDGGPKQAPAPSIAPIPSTQSASEQQKLSDTVVAELKKRISAHRQVMVEPTGAAPTTEAVVIVGCFTQIEEGNAAKRMAGMGLGASHLSAHVRIARFDGSAFTVMKDLQVSSSGAMKMPPIGPIGVATHAAAESRETLNADAKRMADSILKQLKKSSEQK